MESLYWPNLTKTLSVNWFSINNSFHGVDCLMFINNLKTLTLKLLPAKFIIFKNR